MSHSEHVYVARHRILLSSLVFEFEFDVLRSNNMTCIHVIRHTRVRRHINISIQHISPIFCSSCCFIYSHFASIIRSFSPMCRCDIRHEIMAYHADLQKEYEIYCPVSLVSTNQPFTRHTFYDMNGEKWHTEQRTCSVRSERIQYGNFPIFAQRLPPPPIFVTAPSTSILTSLSVFHGEWNKCLTGTQQSPVFGRQAADSIYGKM